MIKYIGLDAHSSTCTFNVTDERGGEKIWGESDIKMRIQDGRAFGLKG
ncbi:MAG: hypothetical protein ACK41Q_13705 [Candidatus Brocadia sp.]